MLQVFRALTFYLLQYIKNKQIIYVFSNLYYLTATLSTDNTLRTALYFNEKDWEISSAIYLFLHGARGWNWAASKNITWVCPVLSTAGEVAILYDEQDQHGSCESLNWADKSDRAIYNISWLVFRKDWALITYFRVFCTISLQAI